MADSKFGKRTAGKAGGISSGVASPTSVLLQEEGMTSNWELGQLPLRSVSSSQEGQLVVLPMQHGSVRGNIGCSQQAALGGIGIGRESQILREALEHELRSDWEMGTSTAINSGDAQAGSGSFDPASPNLCANSIESLGVNSSGRALSKRRPRVSRRLPTTMLEASCTDFRDMVQKLTGVPISTLRPKGGELLIGAHIVRPQPKRTNIENTSSLTSQSYASLLHCTTTHNPQFHVNSHRLLQQPAHPASTSLLSVSRPPQGPNPEVAHRSTLSDIHAAGSLLPGYNKGTDIIASLYDRSCLARSSNNRSSPAAATKTSTARRSWTDFEAPSINAFTVPNSRAELGSTPVSNERPPKFVDHELLAGFQSASRYGTPNHILAPETKQGADLPSSRSYSTTVASAECALAELRSNVPQDRDEPQLLFSQMDFWLQSDQLTGMCE